MTSDLLQSPDCFNQIINTQTEIDPERTQMQNKSDNEAGRNINQPAGQQIYFRNSCRLSSSRRTPFVRIICIDKKKTAIPAAFVSSCAVATA